MQVLIIGDKKTPPPGTIGQILKSGYKLKDRVIRAAEVGTVTKSDWFRVLLIQSNPENKFTYIRAKPNR